jgi:hypothetical protein
MKNNEMMRLGLIVVAACVFIYLIHSYNDINNIEQENFFAEENVESPPNNYAEMLAAQDKVSIDNVLDETEDEGLDSGDESSDPLPAEDENNETFRTVPEEPDAQEQEAGNESAGRLPNECYPKDVLTPQDLLPQDSNSTWAQTVPSGQGSLGDQNFLNAGFHVGINTVGQSLRNANLQLRSEPANPQLKVSPWLQSTIDPDANRRAMEIGA